MSRGRYIPMPPGDLPPQAQAWARAVTDVLVHLPNFSIISTSNGPNTSGVTADLGTLAIDVGSSVTRLWQKRSASTSTTGWSALSWI